VHDHLPHDLLADEVSGIIRQPIAPNRPLHPFISHELCPPGLVRFVPDLDLIVSRILVLVDIDVDREMGVDVSHLVLVALRYADNEVVDESSDRPQSCDALARAMVQFDVDQVLLRVLE
jgi:hypothetical protein